MLGTDCAFSIAPDDPQRVTFQVSPSVAPGKQLCSQDSFYLSTDGGASWRHVAQHSIAPASVGYGSCDLHATAHHLFLAYSFAPASRAPQTSLLERSDDDGATWTRADGGLGEHALYFMPQIGPGETLALTVLHMPAAWTATPSLIMSLSPELWTSPDAGRTWTRTASLPEHPDTFLWSAPPQPGSTWPNAAHPFYALQTEQIPSELYREGVLASGDGHHWALLPPLPVPGTDAEHWGILQALAALADGRLAVWGADPRVGVPAEGHGAGPMRPFWLWLWEPALARWQMLAAPLDVSAHEGCGLCWQGQAVSTQDGAQCLYVSDLVEAQDYGGQDAGVWRMCIPIKG